MRYITELTSDFDTWDIVNTSDVVGEPVVVPAGLLSGNDFFRVRMEPREVAEP